MRVICRADGLVTLYMRLNAVVARMEAMESLTFFL
jgi:hypothetical protein